MFCLFLGKEKDWGANYHPADNDIEHCGLGFFVFSTPELQEGRVFTKENLFQRGMVVYVGSRVCLQNPCH